MTEDKDIRIIALKCPSCGGALRVPPGTDKAQCEHCGSTVLIVDARSGETRIDVSEVATEEATEAGRRALKVILWSVLISVAGPIFSTAIIIIIIAAVFLILGLFFFGSGR